ELSSGDFGGDASSVTLAPLATWPAQTRAKFAAAPAPISSKSRAERVRYSAPLSEVPAEAASAELLAAPTAPFPAADSLAERAATRAEPARAEPAPLAEPSAPSAEAAAAAERRPVMR